jgi:uncharacterized protein YggE
MLKRLGLGALLWMAQGAVQAADLPAYPFVHVQGQGMSYAMPDVGEIEFEVSAVDADPERVRAVVEERLAAVRALLATHAVPEGDVAVRDVRRDMPKGDPAAAVTYLLKCNVRIKVTTMASWKQIVSGLLDMPNLDGFSVGFDVSDRTKIETGLMADAITNARKKAADIAAGLGRKLGPANGVSMGEIRNLSRSMGLAAIDYPAREGARNVSSDRDALLTIAMLRMGQSVNVIYQLK